jgi:SAM-dependent methyltransferase
MNLLGQDTVSEWDANALARHQQISSGIDLSYEKILVPTITELLEQTHRKAVIDVGCGGGDLAARLSKSASNVIGVDASAGMIQVARMHYKHVKNLKFVNIPVEKYAHQSGVTTFDLAVSNMTLMTVPNLDEVVVAIGSILKRNGLLVATITHPWFWNQYRQLETASTFDYLKEHVQTGPFVISLDKQPLPSETTVFHRPLQAYFEAFYRSGLHVERLLEPFPSARVEKLYPERWRFPRFLAFKCRKVSRSPEISD